MNILRRIFTTEKKKRKILEQYKEEYNRTEATDEMKDIAMAINNVMINSLNPNGICPMCKSNKWRIKIENPNVKTICTKCGYIREFDYDILMKNKLYF